MKIIKPNTTHVPNVIFDYWMDKLTPAEFKVLLCICRKTFGWHKEKDKISIRQIEKMTGLGKSGIIKCTEHLIQLGLVTKHKFKDEYDGSDAPNQYEINVFIPEEIEIENIGGSPLSGQGGVHSVDTPRVHSVDTQKKLLTKERLTKEIDQHNSNYPDPISEQSSDAPPLSSKKKKIEPSQESKDLAQLLFLKLKEINPVMKEPKIDKWAHDIDLAIREDKRSPEHLRRCIEFLVVNFKTRKSDFFWAKAIQSGASLRDKFEKIWLDVAIPKVETHSSLIEKVKKSFVNGKIYNGAECIISPDRISFQRGDHMQNQVDFKDRDFKQKFEHTLHKFGIRWSVNQ